ncbi:MAG: ATP-dependent metallopeptidase FtsH/Yme1/Tma family protein [Candidatus Saccharibacteria bacterium]
MRNAGFIALIILLLLVVYSAFNQPSTLKTIPITTAIKQANAGEYSNMQVTGNEIQITLKGDSKATFKTFEEPNATLKDRRSKLFKG